MVVTIQGRRNVRRRTVFTVLLHLLSSLKHFFLTIFEHLLIYRCIYNHKRYCMHFQKILCISDTCGGEVCTQRAECIDDKCTCKPLFYGDGTTCKSKSHICIPHLLLYIFQGSRIKGFTYFLLSFSCITIRLRQKSQQLYQFLYYIALSRYFKQFLSIVKYLCCLDRVRKDIYIYLNVYDYN